jgi:hypothetical protein
MQITFAQIVNDEFGNFSYYRAIKNGVTISIPNDAANSDYILMMQEVADGQLTITPAA